MFKYFILFMFFSSSIFAQVQRFSGNKIPRVMTLKTDNVNARVGPNIKYPIKFIYKRKFLPLIVINEYFGWYQVKDMYGDLSWVSSNYLNYKPYAITNKNNIFLYEEPDLSSNIIAKVDKEIIFYVYECKDLFCEVKTNYNNNDFEGFIFKTDLFGI